MIHPSRPPTVDCPDWEPPLAAPTSKRCRYYNDNGTCQMPMRLMCTEYLKKNPHLHDQVRPKPEGYKPPPVAELLQAPPARASAAPTNGFALTPAEPPKPPKGTAAAAARAAYRAALPGGSEVTVVEPPPGDPIPILDPKRVAELAAVCQEARLVSPELGEVFLVKARTPADRLELTFEDAALLTTVIAVFPGARLVELRKRPVPSAVTHEQRVEEFVRDVAPASRPALPLPCWGCDKNPVEIVGELCDDCAADRLTTGSPPPVENGPGGGWDE